MSGPDSLVVLVHLIAQMQVANLPVEAKSLLPEATEVIC